ncbi:MAG: Uma2 family endonuclease [Bacteroidota bacterium]
MEKFELDVTAFRHLSDEEFFHFCQDNNELRIERDATGKIIIMAPTGSLSGNRNFDLYTDFAIWNRQHKKGYFFDSSAGFTLPNGATRSPDVSFVLKHRWEVLSEAEQEVFAPVCPDFVLELRSKNDSLKELQDKMAEYVANGTTFGWLIDPYERKAYIYDAQQKIQPFSDFSRPLRGRYFMDDFYVVLDDVLA